jgi:hypothetical protein
MFFGIFGVRKAAAGGTHTGGEEGNGSGNYRPQRTTAVAKCESCPIFPSAAKHGIYVIAVA